MRTRALPVVAAASATVVLVALDCRPSQPVPSPSLPATPVNPSTREVAEEIIDASIVSDGSAKADVAVDAGALPSRNPLVY